MIPASLLNESVTVYRRTPVSVTPRDSLNNPSYGTYTTGLNVVYTGMPVRFAFNNKSVVFSKDGERIQPTGTMYYTTDYVLNHEDRLITQDGIEYVVTSIRKAFNTSSNLSHYEAIVELP